MSALASDDGALITIWADEIVQYQCSSLPHQQNMWQNLKSRDFLSTKSFRQHLVMFAPHILCTHTGYILGLANFILCSVVTTYIWAEPRPNVG